MVPPPLTWAALSIQEFPLISKLNLSLNAQTARPSPRAALPGARPGPARQSTADPGTGTSGPTVPTEHCGPVPGSPGRSSGERPVMVPGQGRAGQGGSGGERPERDPNSRLTRLAELAPSPPCALRARPGRGQ